MKPKIPQKHYIEILPAAWLAKRDRWQSIANRLPNGGCLLVTNPENIAQTKLFQAITRSFRQKGRQVVLWSV